ncbi:hypothetical protein M0802_011378 [Mischocyttarus mexicanus]|nr:hypothetical protein M0802_011378 [Mischocyttarus mexicanus]
MMPLEIGWAITVSWKAGDAMCRIMAFFRVFGLYLSSFVLVCISMDRYYAVIKPLQLLHVDRRGKIMLTIAWLGSIFCSIPQMMVFHLETHPNITWYSQCITFNTFPTYTHELTYSLFGMLMMYWLPLTVIIYTYTSILLEICKRSKESVEDKIRRSSLVFLSRAKIRTLKMTIIIVAVFFICWTPYYVMSLWYWIDRTSARKVDQKGTTSLTNNPTKGRGISHEQSKDNCIPKSKDRVVDLQLKTITGSSIGLTNKTRKKPNVEAEPLLAVKYGESNKKTVLMLDRRTNRVCLTDGQLTKTLNELIQGTKRIWNELEINRRETQELRILIENCVACRQGLVGE